MIFLLFNNAADKITGEILDTIGAILNTIWLILCGIVYDLLSYLFVIFSKLITIDILTEGQMKEIYNRVTMIFTIVMTFYIVFEFVKYTVSPKQITDKEKGAMPLFARIVISIVLLAFVPSIFSGAMKLQSRIIDSNVLPNMILGTSKVDGGIAGYGREFVGDVVSAFIRVDCDLASQDCQQVISRAENLVNSFKYSKAAFADSITRLWAEDLFTFGIDFDGFLALIFGGFMLYVLFMYCKDIALRYIQLIFLQIISPIAIISYIGPKKDGMFQKWLKQCTTTYLDVFIRMAVLYFLILIMKILGEQYNIFNMTRNGGENLTVGIWEYLFLVGGLLAFMLKAPKLLKELFPSSGAASIGFGFSAKERKGPMKQIFGGATKAVAGVAGTVAGAKRGIESAKNKDIYSSKQKSDNSKWGKLNRFGTAANVIGKSAYAGGRTGFKDGKIGDAIRTGQEKAQGYEEIVSKGGTVLGHDYRGGHYQNEKVELQIKLDLLKSMGEAKSAANAAIGEIKFRKQMDDVAATLESQGNTSAKIAWGGEIKKFEKLARNYASGTIDKTEYENAVESMITKFNATNGTSINMETSALEIDSKDKYDAITTRMRNAEEVAQDIINKGITYEYIDRATGNMESDSVVIKYKTKETQADGSTQIVDKVIDSAKQLHNGKFIELEPSGEPRMQMNSNGVMDYVYIKDENGNDLTFADYIGDFADRAASASIAIDASKEAKKIKTNADGKK